MLNAARTGNWEEVVKLEGACVLLITQLKHAADAVEAGSAAPHAAVREAAQTKSRLMQRILTHDAEIRNLAEPWLDDLDRALEGRSRTLH